MKKYLMTVEYFGLNYVGWQNQKNGESVQETLEKKLSVLLREDVKILASGRTDSGVHAYGQKAHFITASDITPFKILGAVNSMLPPDIRITDIHEVPMEFHAQYSAKRKTYRYKMYVSRIHSPIRNYTHAQVIPPIDYEKMQEAASLLVGTHDFTAFSSAHAIIKNKVRTLYKVELKRDGDEITVDVEGNGFLYNMVRIIVGTLVWVGKGKRSLDDVKEALATGNREKAGKTFPPHALYLLSVDYGDLEKMPQDGTEGTVCDNTVETKEEQPKPDCPIAESNATE